MSEAIEFEVEGLPVPKDRPRLGAHSIYTPQKTKDYEMLIADTALLCKMEQGWKSEIAFYKVFITLTKTKTKIRVEKVDKGKKILKGDIDNYVKSVLDGIVKGRIIPDDNWVVEINAKITEDFIREENSG